MLILVSILGIGFLILIHELGHFLAAKACGMRVEKFYIGFPPALARKKSGETEYGIGAIPLGGYVKISGMTREEMEELPEAVRPRTYFARPIRQRVITIAAGPLANLLLAFLLFFAFHLLAQQDYREVPVVSQVVENSGAAAAGVQAGDRLLAIDSLRTDDPEALRQEMQARPDQQVNLTLVRNGEETVLPAFIGRRPENGAGLLGILFSGEPVGPPGSPPGEALKESASDTFLVTRMLFITIKDLFVSEKAREEISSPIGITAVSSEAISMGWGSYALVLGLISLNLAIFNLLPLLPLDGGHVLFNVIEKVRRRPIRKETFERISAVGLALFAILFIMGVTNDIQRLAGPGFGP